MVLSQQTLGQALQEHPALLVEFCECRASVAGGPAGATRVLCSTFAVPLGAHRAVAELGLGSRLNGWEAQAQGRASQVSPRLFREGPASTGCTVHLGLHSLFTGRSHSPVGLHRQTAGAAFQGCATKARPKPTLGGAGHCSPTRGLKESGLQCSGSVWPRLR